MMVHEAAHSFYMHELHEGERCLRGRGVGLCDGKKKAMGYCHGPFDLGGMCHGSRTKSIEGTARNPLMRGRNGGDDCHSQFKDDTTAFNAEKRA